MRVRCGISSTLPIEILLAAGRQVLDLNNRFIAATDPGSLLARAHADGLARTYCSWTKGVYAAALEAKLDEFVIVSGGDCTHSRLMAERLAETGLRVISFCYPFQPDAAALASEMEALADTLGTSLPAAEKVWSRLRPLREKLAELDRLSWQSGQVRGGENHFWLISGSDLGGNSRSFARKIDDFLATARKRPVRRARPRLAVIGIPPIFRDLYERLDQAGVQVVYNELAREFSMAEAADSLLDQYLRYSYPYSVEQRLERIRREISLRRVDGLIHYTQSFCFHHTERVLLRDAFDLPLLQLEGHEPGPLDARSLTRLEAFLTRFRPPRRQKSSGRRAGLDIGSRQVKLLIEDGSQTLARSIDTSHFYRSFLETGRQRFDRNFLGSLFPDLSRHDRLTVTGYGREKAVTASVTAITEIQAHALGAWVATKCPDFLLVDIGGQDTKVIRVHNGRVGEFELNDRCAAGSGRYLENMARILGLTMEELGAFDVTPVRLDCTCATFGETELVGRILGGASLAGLAAGVTASVVERLLPVLRRVAGAELKVLPVFLAGGGSRCPALARGFSRHLGAQVTVLPDPAFNGARGCLEWSRRFDD